MTTTNDPAEQAYPGRALGLPEEGVGSVASMAARVGAFLIDILLSALAAWWITAPEAPRNTSLLVWAVMTVVTVGLFGITPGQAALGIRVVPMDKDRERVRTFVGLWAIPRTALIFLIVPPLLLDANGRGLHDRLCRTVVLRIR